MTAGPSADLSGSSILVVEDEFYLAIDVERVLRNAGALVVGPFPTGHLAIAALNANVSAAVVDLNLRRGPEFEVARALRAAGVPFVFLTGYDSAMIPAEFADIDCFQKPANFTGLLRKLAQLVRKADAPEPI